MTASAPPLSMERPGTVDRETLRGLPLLAGLSDEDIHAMGPHAIAEQHVRGGLVFRRGDRGHALYIVIGEQAGMAALDSLKSKLGERLGWKADVAGWRS